MEVSSDVNTTLDGSTDPRCRFSQLDFLLSKQNQYAVSGTSAATSKVMEPRTLKLSNIWPGQCFVGRPLEISVAAGVGFIIKRKEQMAALFIHENILVLLPLKY